MTSAPDQPADGPADGASAGTESEAAPKPTLDKKKTIIGAIVTLIVLGIVFLGIFPKIGSYSEAWDAIQTMPLDWLLTLIASVLVMLWLYVYPYTAAIPGLRYGPAFVIRQTSFTISNGVPAGGALGLGLQYAMLASYKIPGPLAAGGIAITSVWSVFMTLGLPIMGVLAMVFTGQSGSSKYLVAGVVGLVAIAASVVVFWLILRSEPSARKIGHIGDKIVAPVGRKMHKKIDVTHGVLHFREGIVDVVRRRWIWITVSNLLVTFSQYAVLYIAIRAVGGSTAAGFSVVLGFAAFAISRLASMIPITPGGLGTVDAALIGLLVGFGLDESVALAADLVWRAASFVPQVLLGVGTFVWWRARQARVGGL